MRKNFSSIKRKNEIWRTEEIRIIKKYYEVLGSKVCRVLKNRTKSSVSKKACSLNKRNKKRWTKRELNILRKYYSEEGCKVVLRINRTINACKSMAYKLGLKCLKKNKWRYEDLLKLEKRIYKRLSIIENFNKEPVILF